jgi:hypothetical protein
MMSRWNGFAHGVLRTNSLLDSPLIVWDNTYAQGFLLENVPPVLFQLLRHNLQTNPLIKRFQTILEYPHPKYCVPVLSSDAISNIISDTVAKNPVQLPVGDDNAATLLSTIDFAHFAYDNTLGQKQKANSTFDIGAVKLRETSTHERVRVKVDGTCTCNGEACSNSALTLETALFPFLFPFGKGFFNSSISLTAYLRMRMQALFTPFTLFLRYLLLMYQVRKSIVFLNGCRDVAYESQIKKNKKDHPLSQEEDVIAHVLKHCVPQSIAGSPQWHKRNLRDLMCMVDSWGMPHFSLTLTADEMSRTKWAEIVDLEQFLERFNLSFDWRNAPVECCRIFHARLRAFFKEHVLSKRHPILGRVLHYVIRYKVQSRGSLHAHTLLWLDDADVDRVTNEICAYVPGSYDPIKDEFAPPPAEAGPEELQLYHYVVGKQLHTCRDSWCRRDGPCKSGFPYAPHYEPCSQLDSETGRWKYFRPGINIGTSSRIIHPYFFYGVPT